MPDRDVEIDAERTVGDSDKNVTVKYSYRLVFSILAVLGSFLSKPLRSLSTIA